jgi:hypothetical protein
VVGTIYIYVYVCVCVYIYMYIYNSHGVMRIEKGTSEIMAVDNFKSMRRVSIMLDVK